MPQLYNLTNDYVRVLAMSDEDVSAEALKDTLDMIKDEIEDKAENIAKLVRSLESDAAAIKEEEQRLKDRRSSIENKVTNLKAYLQQSLEVAGLQKIKRPTLTVAIQNNPPSVEVVDEILIPSHYMIPQPSKVDKKSILSLLKEGQEIPGVQIKQTQSLRIR
jgi:LPS O-antigen subunit length determinant protein (WzzB/FepE family)